MKGLKQKILLLNFYEGFKGLQVMLYAPSTKCLYCGPRLYHSERIMFNMQNEEKLTINNPARM